MPKKAPVPEVEAEPEEPVVVEDPGEQLDGVFVFPDGAEYNGQYLKKGDTVSLHGQGRLKSGPEVFDGLFENGAYKKGRFETSNGSVYSGSFHKNLFHGRGDYAWTDGRKYSGSWKDGQMHGRGTYHNFSFGVDTAFEGFSVRGRFVSSQREQDEAIRCFMDEYGTDYKASVRQILDGLASKLATAAEPEDPKAKKKGAVEAPPELSPELLAELLVPVETDEDEQARLVRSAVDEVASGPFPEASALSAPTLVAFAALFADGAEVPGQVTVFQDAPTFLRCEQLEHHGQGVEFLASSPEPGQILRMVFVNTSHELDATAASWRLVRCEDAPQPS